ncbi:MAG: DUF3034 family protein [Verrucomicrobiota bacterium]
MKKRSLVWAALAATQIVTLPFAAQAGDSEASTKETKVVKTAEKAPPLPLHTIEGVGGIVITPVAYLVNPGPAGTTFGLPSASATYVKANQKNVETLALTETLFGRVELGYGASRFGIGSLVDDVKDLTTIQIPDSVTVHNVNARVLALPEGSFGLALPALTVGVSYKYNDGIADINQKLGGALTTIGYDSNQGVDYTVTATKAFPHLFGRPLLITGGLRVSKAAQLGYLGFGDKYRPTFEGNIAYGLNDWLWLAGEFRGKANPYQQITNPVKGGNLIQREDNWWTVGAAFVINPHATVTVGWGHFGPVLNTDENKAVAIQAKYEF